MIIWANRLYRKNRSVSAPVQAAASAEPPVLQAVYPVSNVSETHKTQVVNSHEVYAPKSEHTVLANRNTQQSEHRTVNTHNQTSAIGDTVESKNITYHTTVQVDMVNHNQIHGEQDMVHLAERLSDALYAALESGGEGAWH